MNTFFDSTIDALIISVFFSSFCFAMYLCLQCSFNCSGINNKCVKLKQGVSTRALSFQIFIQRSLNLTTRCIARAYRPEWTNEKRTSKNTRVTMQPCKQTPGSESGPAQREYSTKRKRMKRIHQKVSCRAKVNWIAAVRALGTWPGFS